MNLEKTERLSEFYYYHSTIGHSDILHKNIETWKFESEMIFWNGYFPTKLTLQEFWTLSSKYKSQIYDPAYDSLKEATEIPGKLGNTVIVCTYNSRLLCK